jgi:hypothetical protein
MTDCTAYVPRPDTSTAPICGNCTGIIGDRGVTTRIPGTPLGGVSSGSGAGPDGGEERPEAGAEGTAADRSLLGLYQLSGDALRARAAYHRQR